MAALLPAIHNPNGKGPLQQHRIKSPPKEQTTRMPQLVDISPNQRRTQGKREREIENRRAALRAQQPYLTKLQTAQYRYDYKHNLCVDMLREGYHKSFCELFALIKRQNDERIAAGPDSSLWGEELLEKQPDKLQTLKQYLTQAEISDRKEDFVQVYKCQLSLAKYFQETGDKWLADHFYAASLATASSVTGDGGRTAAEGHCNVALALENSGRYFDATDNFEKFYSLAKDQENGSEMHRAACIHLCRIYTTVADRHEANGDLEQYLSFLSKAHQHAREGGDEEVQAESGYRLGVAYEKNGESETALKYLMRYLETCQATQNNEGIGKACQAIAKSYESREETEKSLEFLETFLEVAERSRDDRAISRACSDLGAMLNSLGRYELAVEYFNKSYNIARASNDAEGLNASRVLFGVAAAHKMLHGVARHVDVNTRPCVERLVDWKNNRADQFDGEIPQPETAEESVTPRIVTSEPFERPDVDSLAYG